MKSGGDGVSMVTVDCPVGTGDFGDKCYIRAEDYDSFFGGARAGAKACPVSQGESDCAKILDAQTSNDAVPQVPGSSSFSWRRSEKGRGTHWWSADRTTKGSYAGPGGIALGYQYRNFDIKGGKDSQTTHGIHVDSPLVWTGLMLPFVYPSLTIEADLGFPSVQASGGIGPGVHFILPTIIQAYGKLMLDGHAASFGDKGSFTGWSAEAVAGAQLLVFYGEGRFPVGGSNELRGKGGFDVGFRLGF